MKNDSTPPHTHTTHTKKNQSNNANVRNKKNEEHVLLLIEHVILEHSGSNSRREELRHVLH